MSSQIALSSDAQQVLKLSGELAMARHQHLIDTEHLLVGALKYNEVARDGLQSAGLSPDALVDAMLVELGMIRDTPLDKTNGLTKRAKERIADASKEARVLGHSTVHAVDLVIAILSDPGPLLQEILDQLPSPDLDTLRSYVRTNVKDISSERVNVETLVGGSPQHRQANKPPTIVIRNEAAKRDRENLIFAGIVVALVTVLGIIFAPDIAISFLLVIGGWILSLTLHEFGHALVAYWGGDHSVRDKGYLTMNPLKYTHPFLSIGLPLLFLAMGGFGLPGGAVYIETRNLRSKYWSSAVSIAGPAANLLCLIVFSAPFWTGYVTYPDILETEDSLRLWSGVAFLCWVQVMAILFNLIPIPPLDGFGVIEPFLSPDFAYRMRSMGSIGLFLIILLFWLPSTEGGLDFPGEFFRQVDAIAVQFDVDVDLARVGLHYFQFWEN
ncbi:MAG: hypothetical protein L0154_04345 [Chloroflexi bacterium]|nr:hypothetical protein [Chloroflexota bacterium]